MATLSSFRRSRVLLGHVLGSHSRSLDVGADDVFAALSVVRNSV